MSKQTPPTISINIALVRPRVGQGIRCICISPMVSFQLLAFPIAETMNDIAIRPRPLRTKHVYSRSLPHSDIQVRLRYCVEAKSLSFVAHGGGRLSPPP